MFWMFLLLLMFVMVVFCMVAVTVFMVVDVLWLLL